MEGVDKAMKMPNLADPTILDLETTVYNRADSVNNDGVVVGDFPASPFHPKNAVVAVGTKYAGIANIVRNEHRFPSGSVEGRRAWNSKIHTHHFNNSVWVGHNIGFDLLYLLAAANQVEEEGIINSNHNMSVYNICRRFIWDTMLAEYLLEGQEKPMPSLDYCSQKRGGTLKADIIKEYWNKGYETENIPNNQLLDYLKEDVENTDIVYWSQVEEASDRGMLPLIISNMRARMATIMMEFNGVKYDINTSNKFQKELTVKIIALEHTLQTATWASFTKSGIKFNPSSPQHVSAVLYGGALKHKVEVFIKDENNNPVVYKTGKKKGKYKKRQETREMLIRGFTLPVVDRTPTGAPSTSDEALKNLKKTSLAHEASLFIDNLLTYRKLTKDMQTYYIGYSKLVWPDLFIHGKFNHALTSTGRTSSSKPNLQNLTNT